MTARLVPCATCHRHVNEGDACPFCGTASAELPTGGYGLDAGSGDPVRRPLPEELYRSVTAYGMPPTHPSRVVPVLVAVVAAAAGAYYALHR